MNCLADNQDTDYQITLPPLRIDNGEVIAAVGTLATATGNATYVSMSVNRQEVMQGVKNLWQVDLTQSAAGFGVPDGDKLYAFYLARRCPARVSSSARNIAGSSPGSMITASRVRRSATR